MAVPSPQQYLNAFEGQELTIQKQANTTSSTSSGISGGGTTTHLKPSSTSISGGGLQNNSSFPIPSSPQTPTSNMGKIFNSFNNCDFLNRNFFCFV